MVKICERGASLFAIDIDSGETPIHRRETPLAVASQPQAAAGIIPGKCLLRSIFWNRAEEILTKEQIFDSIIVEIADVHRKHRRELRFSRQRYPVKMGPAVQKYAG